MAFDCDCIKIVINDGKTITIDEINSSGDFNGQPYWEYTYESVLIYLFWDTDRWYINDVLGSTINPIAELQVFGCPYGKFVFGRGFKINFEIFPCGSCVILEDRTQAKFNAVKLPKQFVEEKRGFKECCLPELVLANGSSNTWQNDVTSAWIKLSSTGDTATFNLTKDGQTTIYSPVAQPFVKEFNAFYTTIKWLDVLASDGVGCYELSINFDIAGVSGTFVWGLYNLELFTIQNALRTARTRVILNSYQEIEGIDFTDSAVEDTFRFFGYIGNRQPNTEIDNIIYDNREMKKVIRENLNSFEIITDPLKDMFISRLTDIHLLSENQLFISDYNAHNHSYRINDLPVILQDSPEITYFDFARDASLKAVVSDKFKNKRSYFK